VAVSEGCSWYDFAAAIFELAGLAPDFAPTTAAEFGGPVARPAYSVLGTSRSIKMPPWRAGLERYMREKHGI
jgi:dTDP-4-dehydrorhamnose reductase